MSDAITIIAGILLSQVIFWLIIFPLGVVHDKKLYNNGTCPKCGGEYYFATSDSQGGMNYVCSSCNHWIWISWYSPKDQDR